MIISDSQKQVFCHIPKNGGSSLRAHFMTQWADAREYQGRRSVAALENEMRDLTHITPLEAKSFFDDDLIGKQYEITAVIRAPIPRFSSALLQYIRSFRAEHKQFVSAQTVLDVMADTSVPDICKAASSDMRYIYFRPQVDFLEAVPDAMRNLIPMEQLSVRFPDLAVENQGGRLPSWLKALKHPTLKRLAGGLGDEVKGHLARALIQKDPEISAVIGQVVEQHKDFLDEFYSQDQTLYNSGCIIRQ